MTIGASLTAVAPNSAGYNCNGAHQCTVKNNVLAPNLTAPGGLASPVKGTVVSFQVRTGPSTDQVQLRILRPAAAGAFTGAGTSGFVTPPINSISPVFPVSLPIQPGDVIGLTCCQSGNNSITTTSSTSSFATWGTAADQPLADGETRAPDSASVTGALLVNAAVEPDNAFTLGKARLRGGKVKVAATVPNAGFLSAVLSAAPGAKPKKRCHFLCWTAMPVSGPGTFVLRIPLGPRARSLLRSADRVVAKAPVFYSPTFGTTSSKRLKVKLKG